MLSINKEIKSLPPLPETVIKVNEFKVKKDKEIGQLVELLENDPLVVSNVLKTANSAMFAFRNPVETFSRAVGLLGLNMTISLTISAHITNSVPIDIDCYNVPKERFISKVNDSSSLLKLWVSKSDRRLTENIILPALVMEVGKFVVASFLKNNNKENEFKEYLKNHTIEEAEINFIGKNSYEVAAMVFEHWDLGDSVINPIKNINNPNKCNDDNEKQIAKYLKVISTLLDLKEFKTEKSIQEGKRLSKEFGLKFDILEEVMLDLE